MRYYVDDSCIGCGLCEGVCPEVFQMTDSGIAEASEDSVEGTIFDKADEAMSECPANAIYSKDE